MTISTGVTPPERELLAQGRANAALSTGSRRASVSTPETPVFMSMRRRGARQQDGRRHDQGDGGGASPRCGQAREPDRCGLRAAAARRRRRPQVRAAGGGSRRRPGCPARAGSRVSAASTETLTTRIAPAARLPKMLVGTMSMPQRASTTVMPLKNTARLAVPAGDGDRRRACHGPGPLLAEARDDEQGVVDADGEAHHADHVDGEDRDVERLAHERRQWPRRR